MDVTPKPLYLRSQDPHIRNIDQIAAMAHYLEGADQFYRRFDVPVAAVMARPAIAEAMRAPLFDFFLVDYVPYICPIRDKQSMAVQDKWGRYWLGMNWCAGAEHWDTVLDLENRELKWQEGKELPYRPNHVDWQCLMDQMNMAAINLTDVKSELAIDSRMEPGQLKSMPFKCWTTMPEGLHPNPDEEVSDRVRLYWSMRSALIYRFDMTYGSITYHISQVAARAAHRRRTASRKSALRRKVQRREKDFSVHDEPRTPD